MNEVTATAGEVVVPKVPPIPDVTIIQFWNGERWLSMNLMGQEPEAYAKGRPYRPVFIPGEEVKS